MELRCEGAGPHQQDQAKRQGITWELDHEGGRHTVYTLDGLLMPIPRHNEVNELTAAGILKDCQPKLGEGSVAEMSKTYTVRAQRSGKYWALHIPEIDRHTQARNLAEIEPMARELISIIAGVTADQIELNVVTELPAEVSQHLRRAEELRAAAARAQSDAATEVRAAAVELKESGISLRDLGKLLGVSFQRAGQLTKRRS